MTEFKDILHAIEVAKGTLSIEGAYNDDDEQMESIFPTFEDTFDRYGWERMFHYLPQEQLELLICRFLGYTPEETVKILHYPNIVRYYNVSAKLRKIYQERKQECLDYN